MFDEAGFPVYILAKDCGEVTSYPSLEVMNGYFEAIDVENNEYEAWDAQGYPLNLTVSNAAPQWLSIQRSGNSSISDERFADMKGTAKQYREPEGLMQSLIRVLFRR